MNKLQKMILCWAALLGSFGSQAAVIKVETEVLDERDEKIGVLRAGANVEVIEGGGEWLKARYVGTEASFICFVKAADVDETVPMPTSLIPAAPQLGGDLPPAAAATPTNLPPTNAPSAKLVSTRTGPSLALAANWQVQTKAGAIAAEDLKKILRKSTTNDVKLAAVENYVLYKDLYYMMPLADALKRSGQPAASPEPVNTPGFPTASFKAYSFDPKTPGINRLTLVVDLKNQLVAVQTTDSGQKSLQMRRTFKDAFDEEIELDGIWYSRDIKLYDLIGNRSKGTAHWCVAALVNQNKGVLQIDTELIDNGPNEDDVHSRERVRLYIPKQVANICRSLLDARK